MRIVILLLVLINIQFIKAQITTSNISGLITDNNKEVIPGATVKVENQSIGIKNFTVSNEKGFFNLSNLKSGGPYAISISFVGFKTYKEEGVVLKLGKTYQMDVSLQLDSNVLETYEIVAKNSHSNQVIQSEDLQKVPTLNRSIQDITKLIPQGNQGSFGGVNYRFNNLNIDGVGNNDALGFQEPASGAGGTVASGTPGALAGTQPISLESLSEITVETSPFDVKQGNFTGANINAVTKSGTNETKNAIYFFGRNNWLTGKSVDVNRTPIAAYYDYQSGVSSGGAIKKNKSFYFVNYEFSQREEPVLYAPGSAGSSIPLSVAQQISDTLKKRYNYDPGSYGDISNKRASHKFFLKFDFYLNEKNHLIVRDNMVQGFADNLERGANFLKFKSQGFRHKSLSNSLVAELQTKISNKLSNHLILGWNKVKDSREIYGDIFPHIEITYNTANTILLGSYREASIYGLDLSSYQITDNINFTKNRHLITLGTTNNIYNIKYSFLTAWNGRWEYKSLDKFWNNEPSRIRGVYNKDNNDYAFNKSTPSASLYVMLLSGYVQDKYYINEKLTTTVGVRMDMQLQPDKPTINENVYLHKELDNYHNQFGGVPQINPRVKIDYDVTKKSKLNVGSGLFTGRIPFAWYAYTHYISGTKYGNIDLKPSSPTPLTSNLLDLQSSQPNLTEINLIDNNFSLPRDWKSTLSYKIDLPKKMTLSFDAFYSKVIQGIQFKSVNIKDSSQYVGADDRFYYVGSGNSKKLDSVFTNIYVLTNTNKGFSYYATVTLSKQFKDRGFVRLSYNLGKSKDISNGVRNSMAANFNWNQAVNSNNPTLAYSNFDIRHKIVLYASGSFNIFKQHKTIFTLVYTMLSGSPFSFVYSGNQNNDSSSKNDLLFVPKNKSDINLVDQVDNNGNVLVTADEQWLQLDSYIDNDAYLSSVRGNYAERNGARTPWNNQLDLRILQEIKLKNKKQKLSLTLDIINALNVVNRSWGLKYFVPNIHNSSYQLIDFAGRSNNVASYQFNNPQGKPYQIDQFNSRWQAQFGLRFEF